MSNKYYAALGFSGTPGNPNYSPYADKKQTLVRQGVFGKLKDDPSNAKIKYGSIKDGASNTAMVIESAGTPGAFGPGKAVFPVGALTASNNGADYAVVAGQYAYTGRRLKKRDYRALWIQRINAAARGFGLSYSRFIAGVQAAGIEIDRKALADIAVHDIAAFGAIAEKAKAARAAK